MFRQHQTNKAIFLTRDEDIFWARNREVLNNVADDVIEKSVFLEREENEVRFVEENADKDVERNLRMSRSGRKAKMKR